MKEQKRGGGEGVEVEKKTTIDGRKKKLSLSLLPFSQKDGHALCNERASRGADGECGGSHRISAADREREGERGKENKTGGFDRECLRITQNSFDDEVIVWSKEKGIALFLFVFSRETVQPNSSLGPSLAEKPSARRETSRDLPEYRKEMALGWTLRRERREIEEGTSASANGQRSSSSASAGFGETAAARTERENLVHNGGHETDDDAPESLDFQNIYNVAFELRRSSLDPGRRAAFFEPAAESLDCGADGVSAAAVSAVSAAARETDAVVLPGDGSPVALVVGTGGDTNAELKLRGKPFLG